MTSPSGDNGWDEYRLLVNDKLDRNANKLDHLEEHFHDIVRRQDHFEHRIKVFGGIAILGSTTVGISLGPTAQKLLTLLVGG